MVKKVILFLLSIIPLQSFSQVPIGFIDNYSGVNSAAHNPASILNTPYKLDINLFSLSTNLGNTYYSFNIPKFFSDLDFGVEDVQPTNPESNTTESSNSNYGVEDLEEYIYYRNPSKSSNFYGNFILNGPSAIYALNQRKAFGVSSSVKVYSNLYDIDTNIFNRIFYNLLSQAKFDMSTDFFFQSTAWQEIAFTYAFLSDPKPKENFKLGFTFKILKGMMMRTILGDNLEVNLNLNNDFLNTGELFSGVSGQITNISTLPGMDLGLGLDFGFIYEKRDITRPLPVFKDGKIVRFKTAPYRYKIGFSVTDLGFLLFDNVVKTKNNIKISSPLFGSYSLDNFDYTTTFNHSVNFLLPATASFNFDYNLNQRFFLNVNVDGYLYPRKNRFTIKKVSKIDISPRFESKHFSAFLPISLNVFGEARAGFGIRTGYFFVGSSTLFNHFTKYATEFDFTMGFKIPIYSKKYKKEFKEALKNKTPDILLE